MRRLRIGGGVALAVPGDPTRFWSKVIGLGFDEPVTAGLLARVIGFYRAQGMTQAVIQVAPDRLPASWAESGARLGITASGSALVKLVGDIGTVTAATADAKLDAGLRVGPVAAGQAAQWAAVMLSVFGFPAGQAEMARAAIGQPDWLGLAVWDGDAMVATAGLHLYQGTGHLFGGATRPEARGRGAQSALIAVRAGAARQAGCRWIIGETGRDWRPRTGGPGPGGGRIVLAVP